MEMTREEAIRIIKIVLVIAEDFEITVQGEEFTEEKCKEAVDMAIEALEQEPCEMTAEEYRQRMIQAFHNADTDGLIAVCVLPTEKEFEHLEWLLKNHYKKASCDDAVSRQAAIVQLSHNKNGDDDCDVIIQKDIETVKALPPVDPQSKTGHWIPVSEELPDKEGYYLCSVRYMYPPYNFFEPEKVKYMDDVTIQKFDGEFNIEVKAWMPLPEPYKAESEKV